MKATEVIEFPTSDADGTGRSFGLRQKPFSKKSAAGFEAWLDERDIVPTTATSFAAYDQYRSGCDPSAILEITLQVRLAEIGIPYALRASYGVLDPSGMLRTETRREFLAFELVTDAAVDFGTITSATWDGDVYSELGDIIAPPAITIAGNTVTVPESVYGVMEVEVSEDLYEHRLRITPRAPTLAQAESEDDISAELYAATAMLFCQQKIILLDVDLPEEQGTCAGGGGIFLEMPGDDDDEDAELYAVTFEVFDYCTGRVLPHARVSVGDGEPIAAGAPVMLEAGTYSVVATAPGYTDSNMDSLGENDSFTVGRAER